jgi:hypothetical protein
VQEFSSILDTKVVVFVRFIFKKYMPGYLFEEGLAKLQRATINQ